MDWILRGSVRRARGLRGEIQSKIPKGSSAVEMCVIDIKGTGSALLDALQMKVAESSVLYNTSTRVSWSDSQSPFPPVILAEAAFGHGLRLSSTFLTVPSSLGAGSSQQVRSAAWDGRGAQGQPGTAGQQSRGFHPCGHRPPCLFHAWLVGDRASRDSREPALPVASESCFHLTGFSG